jgi:hypothetical protein
LLVERSVAERESLDDDEPEEQTPQEPPPFAQWRHELHVLHARQLSDPVHRAALAGAAVIDRASRAAATAVRSDI